MSPRPGTGGGGVSLALGKVDDDPAGTIREWGPLADYLSTSLAVAGVESVVVKIAPDLETMSRWLASGEVDIFFDNPFSVAFVKDRFESRYFVTRAKTGAAEKHAVFFTTTNSPVRSLADLKGRTVAMEGPESASGFLLPLAHLLEAGLDPVEMKSAEASVPAHRVGYVFTKDDSNTLFWVLTDRIVAGVVDDPGFEEFRRANPGRLLAIARTEPITRNQPGLVGPRVDRELLEAMKRLFLGLDESSETAAGSPIVPPETRLFTEVAPQDEAEVERLSSVIRRLSHRRHSEAL